MSNFVIAQIYDCAHRLLTVGMCFYSVALLGNVPQRISGSFYVGSFNLVFKSLQES